MEIKGIENMTIEQKRDIIVNFNTKFLDAHNCEFIAEYYASRGGKSVHNFELETLALSGVWLDVKKRYALVNADGENIMLESGVTPSVTSDTRNNSFGFFAPSVIFCPLTTVSPSLTLNLTP